MVEEEDEDRQWREFMEKWHPPAKDESSSESDMAAAAESLVAADIIIDEAAAAGTSSSSPLSPPAHIAAARATAGGETARTSSGMMVDSRGKVHQRRSCTGVDSRRSHLSVSGEWADDAVEEEMGFTARERPPSRKRTEFRARALAGACTASIMEDDTEASFTQSPAQPPAQRLPPPRPAGYVTSRSAADNGGEATARCRSGGKSAMRPLEQSRQQLREDLARRREERRNAGQHCGQASSAEPPAWAAGSEPVPKAPDAVGPLDDLDDGRLLEALADQTFTTTRPEGSSSSARGQRSVSSAPLQSPSAPAALEEEDSGEEESEEDVAPVYMPLTHRAGSAHPQTAAAAQRTSGARSRCAVLADSSPTSYHV